jgi:hypothetical protein
MHDWHQVAHRMSLKIFAVVPPFTGRLPMNGLHNHCDSYLVDMILSSAPMLSLEQTMKMGIDCLLTSNVIS